MPDRPVSQGFEAMYPCITAVCVASLDVQLHHGVIGFAVLEDGHVTSDMAGNNKGTWVILIGLVLRPYIS